MADIFTGYGIVILDSTFFTGYFPSEIKEGLKRIKKVLTSESFDSEMGQYTKILPQEKLKIYQSNINFLRESVVLYPIKLNEETPYANGDVWGLIQVLLSNITSGSRFVVVTANKLLEQRIILEELNVDIYDLNNEKLVLAKDYIRLKNQYQLNNNSMLVTEYDEQVKEDSILYTGNGIKIRLGENIHSGAEAGIFRVKGSETIVKVFRKEHLDQGKFENIKSIAGMNKVLNINWAVFPSEPVYYDKNGHYPAGLLEKYAVTNENFDDNALFLGNIEEINPKDLRRKKSYLIDICLNIVRQVCFLNVYGFYICDFNLANFAQSNDSEHIQMWDTDSFGHNAYFSKLTASEFAQSKRNPPYDMDTKVGAISVASEALHQFVFHILSVGVDPISTRGTFKYNNEEYQFGFSKNFIPENIWDYMEDIFNGRRNPSNEALLYHLVQEKIRLNEHPGKDLSIHDMLCRFHPDYEDQPITDYVPEPDNSYATGPKDVHEGNPGLTSGNNSEEKTIEETDSGPVKFKWKRIIIPSGILLIVLLCYVFIIVKPTLPFGSSQTAIETSEESPQESSYFDKNSYIGWTQATAVEDIEKAGWKSVCEEKETYANKKGCVCGESYDEDTLTVYLEISQGPPSEKMSDDISVNVDRDNFVLDEGESIVLTLTVEGDYPGSVSATYIKYDNLEIEGKWGKEWIDDHTVQITFTGNNKSEGYIRLYLIDSNTKEYVGYTDIYAIVL